MLTHREQNTEMSLIGRLLGGTPRTRWTPYLKMTVLGAPKELEALVGLFEKL